MLALLHFQIGTADHKVYSLQTWDTFLDQLLEGRESTECGVLTLGVVIC